MTNAPTLLPRLTGRHIPDKNEICGKNILKQKFEYHRISTSNSTNKKMHQMIKKCLEIKEFDKMYKEMLNHLDRENIYNTTTLTCNGPPFISFNFSPELITNYRFK